jgi:hypothetical protein
MGYGKVAPAPVIVCACTVIANIDVATAVRIFFIKFILY